MIQIHQWFHSQRNGEITRTHKSSCWTPRSQTLRRVPALINQFLCFFFGVDHRSQYSWCSSIECTRNKSC